jgi:predicted DNA-binding transcriptional regulator AlpA
MNERLLDEKEAASLLGMSVAWLRDCRNGRRRKGPPYIKLGTRVRYSRDAVAHYIAECTR